MLASSLTPELERKENSMPPYNPQNSQPTSNDNAPSPIRHENDRAKRIQELVTVLGNHMPQDESSSNIQFLQSFMALRLMLLKPSRTQHENEMEETLLSSYDSYIASGRSQADIALMIVRDYVFLQQLHQPQPTSNVLTQNIHQSANNQQSQQPQQLEATSLQHQGGVPNHHIFHPQQQDSGALNAFFYQAPLSNNNVQSRSTIPDVSNHSYNLNLGGSSSLDSNVKRAT
jgi:hypothetical protein